MNQMDRIVVSRVSKSTELTEDGKKRLHSDPEELISYACGKEQPVETSVVGQSSPPIVELPMRSARELASIEKMPRLRPLDDSVLAAASVKMGLSDVKASSASATTTSSVVSEPPSTTLPTSSSSTMTMDEQTLDPKKRIVLGRLRKAESSVERTAPWNNIAVPNTKSKNSAIRGSQMHALAKEWAFKVPPEKGVEPKVPKLLKKEAKSVAAQTTTLTSVATSKDEGEVEEQEEEEEEKKMPKTTLQPDQEN